MSEDASCRKLNDREAAAGILQVMEAMEYIRGQALQLTNSGDPLLIQAVVSVILHMPPSQEQLDAVEQHRLRTQ